jgi:hypothetical protein
MKKNIILFFLFAPLIIFSQDLTNWQIGLNGTPFLFSRINSPSKKDRDKQQDFPNGFSYGLTIEKNWNENWGFKTGFEISNQNEKYDFSQYSADNDRMKMNFKYHKIPISVQYFYPIKEKLYVVFSQGVQYSILKYYETQQTSVNGIRTYTTDYFQIIDFNNPEFNNIIYGENVLKFHKKDLFGLIGSVGLKGFLSNRISYSTNLRYEFDLNNTDKLNYYRAENETFESKSTVHNFRIGLEVGLQYNFSLTGCSYCKNQNHN